MTLDQIRSMVTAVEAFPIADIKAVLNGPTPANDAQLLADVLFILGEAYPEAEVAAIGFDIAAVMLRNPSSNPEVDAQTEHDKPYFGR